MSESTSLDPVSTDCRPVLHSVAKEATVNRFSWPGGASAALCFSFDDARASQVDTGLPILDELGVRATFYVQPDALQTRLTKWRNAVESGHEIGNHTVGHPCSENFPFGRDRSLENYTIEMMKKECDLADERIRSIFGVTPRTFAYPCGQSYVGRGVRTQSYVPVVAERYLAARCFAEGAVNDPEFCNLHQLAAFDGDCRSSSSLAEVLERTTAVGGWAIFAGHEIGDASARQTTGAHALEETVRRALSLSVWVDTVSAVAEYVSTHRKKIRQEVNNVQSRK